MHCELALHTEQFTVRANEADSHGNMTMTSGAAARLPEGFPEDVPMHPSLKLVTSLSDGASGFTLQCTSDKEINELVGYYQEACKKFGWTEEMNMSQNLAAAMKAKGILAELEAFDSGMINYAKYLQSKNLLEPPHYFNLLLGNIACAQATLLHAGIMVNDLPEHSVWSMAGIGDTQVAVNTMAIAAGGGVRVGLEDNIWWDGSRTRLVRNAELVSRIHRISKDIGRDIMSPPAARELLNLQPGNGSYGRVFSS